MMRLTILHDANGRIAGVFAAPAEGPPAFASAGPEQFVTEVDPSALALPRTASALADRLREIAEHYQVERPKAAGGTATLKRRSTGA